MLAALLLLALDGGDLSTLPTRLPPALMAQVPPAPPATTTTTPPPDPDFNGLDISFAAGASISNLNSTHQAEPFADVVANFPIPGGKRSRGEVEAIFTGLPGSLTNSSTGLALDNVGAFSGVSFSGAYHFVVGGKEPTSEGRTTVGVGGGVSARFTANPSVEKTPGHGEAFIEVSKKDHTAKFRLGVGFSNETGDAATVLRADGRATLAKSMRLQVEVVAPFYNAPSNWFTQNTHHPTRVTVAVGFDLDHLFVARSS